MHKVSMLDASSPGHSHVLCVTLKNMEWPEDKASFLCSDERDLFGIVYNDYKYKGTPTVRKIPMEGYMIMLS